MSSFWREDKREEGRGKKGRSRVWVLLAFFLVSLLPSRLLAGPYADLDARLKGRDREAVAGLRRIAGDDEQAGAAMDKGPRAARAYVALRATLEGDAPSRLPAIGAGPAMDERTSSSWLGRALDRLRMPSFDMPRTSAPRLAVGPWATIVMWTLLAALGGLAVFLLARYARLPGLRRKRRGLVEDDEPEQTADAWVEEANALIAQGRFREAVRGLYVAGLLRFDEAGVARFDRHQTNWEHLRRIEGSPKNPDGTEIRDATGRFDRVWYGHQTVTGADASAMRAWYDALVRRLTEAKAA